MNSHRAKRSREGTRDYVYLAHYPYCVQVRGPWTDSATELWISPVNFDSPQKKQFCPLLTFRLRTIVAILPVHFDKNLELLFRSLHYCYEPTVSEPTVSKLVVFITSYWYNHYCIRYMKHGGGGGGGGRHAGTPRVDHLAFPKYMYMYMYNFTCGTKNPPLPLEATAMDIQWNCTQIFMKSKKIIFPLLLYLGMLRLRLLCMHL